MTDVDQGARFGLWPDATSRLMYHDAMPALLSGLPTDRLTIDLGGANGLAREWFPNLVTVDTDATKGPDVVADARNYVPHLEPGLVLLRYVLHYLPDAQVEALLAHVATYARHLLVIQFVNNDLAAKRANSVNERKWFRPELHLRVLVEQHWAITRRVAVEYDVDPEFYRQRLQHPNPTGHRETVVAYTCEAQ